MYLCDRLSALLGNTFHPLINEEAHQKTFSRQGVCVVGEQALWTPIYYSESQEYIQRLEWKCIMLLHRGKLLHSFLISWRSSAGVQK